MMPAAEVTIHAVWTVRQVQERYATGGGLA